MITILVAENNLKQRTYTTNILKNNFSADCTVLCAKSSQELMNTLDQDPVDILLFDMNMSGIPWAHLTDYLQCNDSHPLILPMADLQDFDPSDIPDNSSVFDFLLKPFTENELIITMEEALFQYSILEQKQDSSPFSTVIRDNSRINIIRKQIERYIREHYCEILSMQDVAKAMNYSDTHFCRLFKQCFQVNFSVYMNNFRIEKAKELLINTNHTVKEVGIFCGYRDTSYFIRIFKRFTGMTPSDYRITKLTMSAKKSNKS